MFLEGFPVLKRIWVLAAAIQPNPRAEEPFVGVGYLNMALGQCLVSKQPPTASCETIVFFNISTLFCWLEVFMLGT